MRNYYSQFYDCCSTRSNRYSWNLRSFLYGFIGTIKWSGKWWLPNRDMVFQCGGWNFYAQRQRIKCRVYTATKFCWKCCIITKFWGSSSALSGNYSANCYFISNASNCCSGQLCANLHESSAYFGGSNRWRCL